ncbi:hypothetical protein GJV85_05010 [Sulfurimonas aquatica]|uniref:Uncharacterized protein n=1 Tax=Sulfurimonas aquatica TaxID=2672570 RepID=A0A975AZS2_9BACT|nr:hypothetical protein [Sulfurimonas aquatica]QSZ41490.1 hypothetical protein GJV85_05010 [Sulfurimonas aquatica]
MQLGFKIKHHFFNAFRELFVHHHGSLEFRAKIFALIISVNEHINEDIFTIVKDISLNIYDGNDDRANLLMMSTKELVQKVTDDNGLDVDSLIISIQKELKIVPRYAKKIDIKALTPLVNLTRDPDTLAYQKNILEFLQKTKDDILAVTKL